MYVLGHIGVWATLVVIVNGTTCCHNSCSGKGKCSVTGNGCSCTCFAGFTGADCSQRLCPTGKGWSSLGAANDQAHIRSVCSNRGTCDFTTGVCTCDVGFTGAACDRVACSLSCSNKGECRSLKYFASQKDLGLPPPVVYNQNWDSDMIYGCICQPGFTGSDCSLSNLLLLCNNLISRLEQCPTGDDPLTGFAGDLVFGQQFNEKQVVTCQASGGTFTLSFKGVTTVPINWNDQVAAMTAKINVNVVHALSTVTQVIITFASTATIACPPTGNVMTIEFVQNFGMQPLLVGNPSNLVYNNVGGSVQLTIAMQQIGTKENAPCSNRGTCDLTSGVCSCYTGFQTSDGNGNSGQRGDCGSPVAAITACPGTLTCSGHGYCSGGPQYVCFCFAGWTSGDCSVRTCPMGPSWFDMPSNNNIAHNLVPCSNAGVCNAATGTCVCSIGYEGAACQRMVCPTSSVPCSGHGQCLTQGRITLFSATKNGNPTPYTYGTIPNKPSTWDWNQIQGCLCDTGYTGHDCSQRVCASGDNPRTTGQTNEMQVLTCTAVAQSTFQISFRGLTSGPISTSATAIQVQNALQFVPSIGAVNVVFTQGATACTAGGTNNIQVYFLTTSGDLPPMNAVNIDTTKITLFVVATDGVSGSIQGTTEDIPCSGGGICNRATGMCDCFSDMAFSNGQAQPGFSEDCGYILPYQT
uniref:Secreted protein n=1 Tax=Thraustotheca clavata TaxID=74557 RepID=A0A0A7CM65_9STRA|nr:secreted protein [Thraustotheca clavata]